MTGEKINLKKLFIITLILYAVTIAGFLAFPKGSPVAAKKVLDIFMILWLFVIPLIPLVGLIWWSQTMFRNAFVELAKEHQLSYSEGNIMKGPIIEGKYKDHYIHVWKEVSGPEVVQGATSVGGQAWHIKIIIDGEPFDMKPSYYDAQFLTKSKLEGFIDRIIATYPELWKDKKGSGQARQ